MKRSAVAAILDAILQERYLATLANLAMRSTATPELRERLMKHVEQGLAGDDDADDYWREWKYRLRVGFDQPQALAGELQAWMRDDPLQHLAAGAGLPAGRARLARGGREAVRGSGAGR